MVSFPRWCSATIRHLAPVQLATIVVCLPLVLILAKAMPQLMVDSQLNQSFSCHTKNVQEFGTTGCSWGKETTLHDRRTLLEDGEGRTGARSTEGAYEILPLASTKLRVLINLSASWAPDTTPPGQPKRMLPL